MMLQLLSGFQLALLTLSPVLPDPQRIFHCSFCNWQEMGARQPHRYDWRPYRLTVPANQAREQEVQCRIPAGRCRDLRRWHLAHLV